jgi:hypothetical protein
MTTNNPLDNDYYTLLIKSTHFQLKQQRKLNRKLTKESVMCQGEIQTAVKHKPKSEQSKKPSFP